MAKKDNNNKLRERPLSPHLSVYKPQITSVLSITHRATGVFLFIGAFFFIWEISATALGGKAYEIYLKFGLSWAGIIIGVLWTLSLLYHFFNGIRHLFWDFGFGFSIKAMQNSGCLVVIATIASAAALFWYVAEKGGLL